MHSATAVYSGRLTIMDQTGIEPIAGTLQEFPAPQSALALIRIASPGVEPGLSGFRIRRVAHYTKKQGGNLNHHEGSGEIRTRSLSVKSRLPVRLGFGPGLTGRDSNPHGGG